MQEPSLEENSPVSNDNMDEDLPLLDELEIDMEQIRQNIKSVIFFKKFDHKFTEEPDMSGPLVVCLALAFSLMLVSLLLTLKSGKIQFGYIYGFTTLGGSFIYFILNLIIREKYFSLYSTISSLGYCLIPLVPLSLTGVFLTLK